MTRKEAIKMIDTLVNNSLGLMSCIIFFRSLIGDTVEERHIFATNINELEVWATHVMELYKKYNMDYLVYINGETYDSNGDICKYFREEDDKEDK